jgi:2'-5' RNA ligase
VKMAQKGIRCFVAVDLPSKMRDQIGVVQQEIDLPGVKLVQSNLVHVTLKFLGDVPSSKVDRLVEALRGIDHPSFTARVKGVGAFPGRSLRVIWIGAQGEFEGLHRLVDQALLPLGFEREGRRFSAHATIARVKRPGRDMNQLLSPRLSQFKEMDLGEFQVSEFVLKKSTLTPEGPIYEDIAAFPLRSA